VKRRLVGLLALAVIACGQSTGAGTRSPTASASGIPSGSPAELADWPQYHRNSARTGQGPLGPSISSPHRAWSAAVDGKVYASPLIVGGHVIAATENNTVYSFDLRSGKTLWKSHLGAPVNAATLPCGDIDPVTGITGTPAADPQTGNLFVVAFLAGFRHVLFTLSLADGSIVRQQVVDPPGSSPQVEQERGALALGSGFVYVSLGGLFGDCGNYHGYVVAVPVGGGGIAAVYRTPSARESGIWSPMGPTVSDTGAVYVTTGNGSLASSFNYTNSVLQLSPDLKLQAYFAPSNWRALDGADADLGSVGATLLPALGVVVSIGKEGVVYVLKAAKLGGVGGQAAALRVCTGAWGGTAWSGSTVFLPCRDALVAVSVSPTTVSVMWRAARVHMGSPIVAEGAVWAIDVDSATLYALDPESGAVVYSLGLGSAEHFSTPAATQGYVVTPAGSSVVAVATNA